MSYSAQNKSLRHYLYCRLIFKGVNIALTVLIKSIAITATESFIQKAVEKEKAITKALTALTGASQSGDFNFAEHPLQTKLFQCDSKSTRFVKESSGDCLQEGQIGVFIIKRI